MHVLRDDLAFEEFVEAAVVAEASANEAIVGIDLHAADIGLSSAKADVGNLMLAAGTRATAEVDADFSLVPTAGRFELIDERDHAVLGLGDCEIAELDAGATDAAFPEIGRLVVEAEVVHLALEVGEIFLGDV